MSICDKNCGWAGFNWGWGGICVYYTETAQKMEPVTTEDRCVLSYRCHLHVSIIARSWRNEVDITPQTCTYMIINDAYKHHLEVKISIKNVIVLSLSSFMFPYHYYWLLSLTLSLSFSMPLFLLMLLLSLSHPLSLSRYRLLLSLSSHCHGYSYYQHCCIAQ